MHIYDGQIARHYAAYRPPLHKLILDEALDGRQFGTGLDVGCGTGYSAIALAERCERVIAVDHSQAMLDRATEHPRITYLLGSGDELPVHDASIDLVTFAGVLSYLNAGDVAVELRRVCRNGALVLAYDFDVILGDLVELFSLEDVSPDDPYDHAANLSGQDEVSTLTTTSRPVELSVTQQQAAHILLSDKARYDPLAARLQSADPFAWVVETLDREQWPGALKAKIYYSLHRVGR